MIVYLARQKSTGMGYVGATNRTLSTRRAEHEDARYKSSFQKILQQYKDDFEWSVLWRGPIEQVEEKEREFIKQINTLWPSGFNKSPGGYWPRRRTKPPGRNLYLRITSHHLLLAERLATLHGMERQQIIEYVLEQIAERDGITKGGEFA